MEKELKIGKSLEGDIAIPEFSEENLEPKEIETLNEQRSESDKDSYLKESFDRHWIEIIQDHIDEFPEEDRALLDKVLTNLREGKRANIGFDKKETARFYNARAKFWEKVLGMKFLQWDSMRQSIVDKQKHVTKKLTKIKVHSTVEKTKESKEIETWEDDGGSILNLQENKETTKEVPETWKQRKERKEKEFKTEKTNRMKQLHQALENLDKGEPVDDFRDETRKVVHYDEESKRHFTEEDGKNKYLGMGDILSDYAWGIKYVPNGDMIEPAYRTLSKRILTNETRREIEDVYNTELRMENATATNRIPFVINRWNKPDINEAERGGLIGIVAEAMVRELISRIAVNNSLNFNVMRASVLEDSVYKYDFKIRSHKTRGVDVQEGSAVHSHIKRIGIQFTTSKSTTYTKKRRSVDKAKQLYGNIMPVDEILVLKVPTEEFSKVFSGWLKKNMPSGGPEQFLSRKLKIRLLKEVTRGLIEIGDEEIKRVFTKEPAIN